MVRGPKFLPWHTPSAFTQICETMLLCLMPSSLVFPSQSHTRGVR